MRPDWNEVLRLARHVTSDEADAQDALWASLWPWLQSLLRSSRFCGPLAERDDYVWDIATSTWEKLEKDRFARLRGFLQRLDEQPRTDPAHSLANWLRCVVKRVKIDYQRRLPEYVRNRNPRRLDPAGSQEGGRWVRIHSLHSSLKGARDPVTALNTLQRMLDYLDQSIPHEYQRVVQQVSRGDSLSTIAAGMSRTVNDIKRLICRARDRSMYRPVLEYWAEGHSFEEIARILDLNDADHATRIKNAARQFLSRKFSPRPV